MKRWETLVDKLVKETIGDGDISHLPGAGQPLQLDSDQHTPDDMRIVFKVMKDHNVAPDWMMARIALDDKEDKLRKQLEIRTNRYQRQLADVRRKGKIIEEVKIEDDWKLYLDGYIDRIDRYNKEVLSYNLSVPKNIPHKEILVSNTLIERALQHKEGDQ